MVFWVRRFRRSFIVIELKYWAPNVESFYFSEGRI